MGDIKHRIAPAAGEDSVSDSGGVQPSRFYIPFKRGQTEQTVTKRYRIYNDDTYGLRAKLSTALDSSKISISPQSLEISVGDYKEFTITVSGDFIKSQKLGLHDFGVTIKMRLFGDEKLV